MIRIFACNARELGYPQTEFSTFPFSPSAAASLNKQKLILQWASNDNDALYTTVDSDTPKIEIQSME